MKEKWKSEIFLGTLFYAHILANEENEREVVSVRYLAREMALYVLQILLAKLTYSGVQPSDWVTYSLSCSFFPPPSLLLCSAAAMEHSLVSQQPKSDIEVITHVTFATWCMVWFPICALASVTRAEWSIRNGEGGAWRTWTTGMICTSFNTLHVTAYPHGITEWNTWLHGENAGRNRILCQDGKEVRPMVQFNGPYSDIVMLWNGQGTPRNDLDRNGIQLVLRCEFMLVGVLLVYAFESDPRLVQCWCLWKCSQVWVIFIVTFMMFSWFLSWLLYRYH